MQLASIHNLSFYLRLVADARHHIEAGTFTEWKKQMVPQLERKL
jgi:queuine tRNA-ribosyltransferase